MAEIQENNNKEKKGNKQKKMNIRVDFTPMVDMNMLLITFFMLCTSLSINHRPWKSVCLPMTKILLRKCRIR